MRELFGMLLVIGGIATLLVMLARKIMASQRARSEADHQAIAARNAAAALAAANAPFTRNREPSGTGQPDRALTLRAKGSEIGSIVGIAVVLLHFGLDFVAEPEKLWTRWLAYPVGILMVLGGLITLAASLTLWCKRLKVDANGLVLHEGPWSSTTIAWTTVASVSIVEVWITVTSNGEEPFEEKRRTGSKLLVRDASGGELLSLDEPMRPEARYRIFLDTIPAWRGIPVVQERWLDGKPARLEA